MPSSRSPLIAPIRRAAGVGVALLAIGASPALAAPPATCEGQLFSQPFTSLGDSHAYTFVAGSRFGSASEGWTLRNGASVVKAARPDGTTGNVLNLPSGAEAVSPTVCVTLAYPTARVQVRDVVGSQGVAVAVAYAGTKTSQEPKNVGQVHGQQRGWTESDPFNVQPQTSGSEEGTRQVQFVFSAGGSTSLFQLFELWIDPYGR